jgi:ribosomal protein S3AE
MVSKNDHFIKKKLYTFLYNKLFIKPTITYVLWNEAEVILQRKQEVSKKEIIEFNKDIPLLPFTNVVKIKNDNLDETLNSILKDIIK